MTTSSSQSLRRRSSRSVPATIAAVILLAGSIAVAWVAISRLLTGSWSGFLAPTGQFLSDQTWSSPVLWAAAIFCVLVGLILFLAAILPGKHTAVRLAGPEAVDPQLTETVISRRGIAKLASSHLDQADGVDSASVIATARKVTATVRTPLHDAPELSGKLTRSLERKFDQIGVEPAPRVTVKVMTTA